MSTAILIHSSVWVEVSRKSGDESLKAELAALLRAGRTAMTWPVWVELHLGAKEKREEENLKGWREELLDGVFRGEGVPKVQGELDLRGDHGPDGAGHADLPNLLDLRRGVRALSGDKREPPPEDVR